jgi:hypothetical protein
MPPPQHRRARPSSNGRPPTPRATTAGFETKTAGAARSRYDALLDELQPAAAAAETTGQCDASAAPLDGVLPRRPPQRQPAQRPRHGAVADDAAVTDDEIRARFRRLAASRSDGGGRRASRLDALAHGRAPIEGIWEMADGSYRGVVLRDDDHVDRFTMSILRRTPCGGRRARSRRGSRPADDGYAVQFFMRDHSEQAWTAWCPATCWSFDRARRGSGVAGRCRTT